jgi:hypothetical protein
MISPEIYEIILLAARLVIIPNQVVISRKKFGPILETIVCYR